MNVISRAKLKKTLSGQAELAKELDRWKWGVQSAKWRGFNDVRATFTKASLVDGKFVVFNMLGNRYRLICTIQYEEGNIYIIDLLTHAEYDRGRWKHR